MSLDKKAFTLLEMLMVIFVMMSICYSFSILYSSFIASNKISQTVMQVSTILDQAKYCAITNKNKSSIKFNESNIEYTCEDKISVYDITSGINIASNYPSNQITFTPKGSVNRAGTVKIGYGEKEKDIVISIGQGGYYVR